MKLNNKNRRQSKASLHMYLDIGRHERSKSLTTLGPYGQFFYSFEIIFLSIWFKCWYFEISQYHVDSCKSRKLVFSVGLESSPLVFVNLVIAYVNSLSSFVSDKLWSRAQGLLLNSDFRSFSTSK